MKPINKAAEFFFSVLMTVLCVNAENVACAQTIDGTWIKQSDSKILQNYRSHGLFSAEYFQILNNKLALSPECVVTLRPKKYKRDSIFQGNAGQKKEEDKVAKNLKNRFSFVLANVEVAYELAKSNCATGIRELLVHGNDMLAVASNDNFYYFRRENLLSKSTLASEELLRRVSPLPFYIENFINLCYPMIPRVQGAAQYSEKCAPIFYPYVASKDSDELARLIGRHHYIRDDPKYHYDFNDPVANGLHPIFLIFPRFKDIIIVRVFDSDVNIEDRDIYGGAYLAIKNGMVVDQIDEGCNLKPDYTCVDREGKKLFRLMESGRFYRFQSD